MMCNVIMKLYHINLDLSGLPALDSELKLVLSRLPEYGATATTEGYVVAENEQKARQAIRERLFLPIATYHLLDPATLRQLDQSFDKSLKVESTDERVIFVEPSRMTALTAG